MALFEEQITDTLETGAPSIKYEGDEGPQDPRQERMLAQLKEEYMQYVFEMKELEEPVMSFEEWYQSVYKASQMGVEAPQEEMMGEEMMMREPAAYGGIMDTESGRRAYGFGSFFKKITKPFKKIAKGAKKLIKSPIGKIGIGALLAGPALGALTGSGAASAASSAGPWTMFKQGPAKKGLGALFKKAIPHLTSPKTLAKIGIGAASALPLLGIGTKAKQDQIENFSQSGDWDENFKSAGGFPGMRRAIARAKDQAELEGLSDQFGFTPGLFPQVAAEGGRIGYAGGELVEGMAEGVEKVGRGGSEIIEKIKEGIGKGPIGPFIDEAIWIEKIKDFIRKKRGEGRPDLRPGSIEELEGLYEGLRPRDPMQPPMRPMPEDMPRRQQYALGSKADFAIEDVMTGGVEDEIGGITGIMRQADLQRKGNIGQFYAAEGGQVDYSKDPNYKGWKKTYETNKDAAAMNENHAHYLAYYNRTKKAEGGIMDLGGMEKDYRETGGFVPIGEYEKKDDVPARLSVNEFVMTADAVRGAGDGDIDLGAERMEDVMKELEQKGKRNQGASDMFEVSERLSEVV